MCIRDRCGSGGSEYFRRNSRLPLRTMKLQDLRPGLFVLTRDVQNPLADKRHKYDWTLWPAWKAGTVFVVRPDADFGYSIKIDSDRYHSARELYPIGSNGDADKRARFEALIDALEPKQDLTLEDRFR